MRSDSCFDPDRRIERNPADERVSFLAARSAVTVRVRSKDDRKGLIASILLSILDDDIDQWQVRQQTPLFHWTVKELRNEDSLSGQAGAHPVGTGVGAALGGAATGAAAGAVAEPIGAAAGAAVGAVAGGLAGKGVAESYDPTVEIEYWRNEYRARPYYSDDYTFADYEPAYRAGVVSRANDSDATWLDAEPDIHASWEKQNRQPKLTWKQARHAAQDATEFPRGRTSHDKLILVAAISLSSRTSINSHKVRAAGFLPHFCFIGLAYVGKSPEYPGCYSTLGFGGNGITFSVIATNLISELVRGHEPEDGQLFRFGR